MREDLLFVRNKGKNEVYILKFFYKRRWQLIVMNKEDGIVCLVEPADGIGIKTPFCNFQQGSITHNFDICVLKIITNGAEGGQGNYQIAQGAGAND